MMSRQWQSLLNQVDVIDSRREVYSRVNLKDNLLAFESEAGFFLPNEYKEFLQFFGTGTFGDDFLYIYYPDIELSKEELGYHLNAGEGFRTDALGWVTGSEYVTSEKAEKARELLNYAFFFGGSSRQESLFWDLRTYSELDQSYDIYIARLGQIPVRICRSFFEFVHDICFGLNPQAVFPLQLQPYLDEITLNFRRSN